MYWFWSSWLKILRVMNTGNKYRLNRIRESFLLASLRRQYSYGTWGWWVTVGQPLMSKAFIWRWVRMGQRCRGLGWVGSAKTWPMNISVHLPYGMTFYPSKHQRVWSMPWMVSGRWPLHLVGDFALHQRTAATLFYSSLSKANKILTNYNEIWEIKL